MSAKTAEKFSELFDKRSLASWFVNGHIYPVFQPQIDSSNDRVVGFECLTRISHPDIGSIAPDQFIRLVESAGLIDEYTLRFIQRCVEELKDILNEHKELTCSFNISALSLSSPFVDVLIRLLDNYQIEPCQITFELTESSAISVSKDALYAISRLKVSGYSFAIDDFGTGYSSIRQLVELPFNELKIDRSFITNIESDKTLQAIVEVMIKLAQSLDYKLIIEGIETSNQLAYITQNGRFIIQGFVYSRPIKLEKLEAFIHNNLNGT
jgi:EAL domain-containing protein (putative c-di-GMP-specific phosphodiesterase class I)